MRVNGTASSRRSGIEDKRLVANVVVCLAAPTARRDEALRAIPSLDDEVAARHVITYDESVQGVTVWASSLTDETVSSTYARQVRHRDVGEGRVPVPNARYRWARRRHDGG
jgi:hypothetical protein